MGLASFDFSNLDGMLNDIIFISEHVQHEDKSGRTLKGQNERTVWTPAWLSLHKKQGAAQLTVEPSVGLTYTELTT